jgi:hypothetical protein
MKTNVEVIKEKTKELLEEGKNLFETMDSFSDWNSLSEIITNFSTISKFINNLVLAVEIAVDDASDDIEELKSEEKVEAAAELMDDMIQLPFFLESIDKKVFSLMISMAVEGLNVKFGKEWNLDVARKAVKEGKEFVNEIADTI